MKKTGIALILLGLAMIAIAVYMQIQAPPIEIIGYQTVTGTVTLEPCPLNPAVNVYALKTTDGATYYLITGTDTYMAENSPTLKPWLSQHLGKTVTLKGEIVTVHGHLSIRNPEVI